MRALPAFVAMLSCLAPGIAEAGIKVHVRWTRVEYEVSPRQEMHVSQSGKTFTLEQSGVVSRGHNLEASSAFEQPTLMETKHGVPYLTKYSIQNGQVIAVSRFPGAIQTIVVSTDGRTACSAEVTYSKLPDAPFFTAQRRSSGKSMLIAELRAQDVDCQISSN